MCWSRTSNIMHFEFPHPEFNLLVLLVSFAVSLGGLALGWFVYRKGMPEGQIDPMRRWLGPVWWAMHRKFWVDEALQLHNCCVHARPRQVHVLD
jgi:hypothetical protein